MKIRIILNGKKASLIPVREAIFAARERSKLEVRATWEAGDVRRLVSEAISEGCTRIVAGGGDGTVNEVVDALMAHAEDQRPELALLPLGTANDFASACTIPLEHSEALKLAQTGISVQIDTVQANTRFFFNIASAGFGAQVTVNTPVALKNFLGGGAYTLAGMVQALNFSPYAGTVRLPENEGKSTLVVGAVCNGPQAGGGQVLAPYAKINDGLLDIVGIKEFKAENLSQVIRELVEETDSGDFIVRHKAPWIEWRSEQLMPVNLDGEPIAEKNLRFEVHPQSIRLVLPEDCPLLV